MTDTPSTTRRSRLTRARMAVAAGIAGAALALAAPAAASAHVGIDPSAAQPGASSVLTFSFSHGCGDSPTTALRITMPDGLTSVAPDVDALWNIDLTRGDDGLVDEILYSATEPVENGMRGTVSMSVRIAEDAAGPLVFPVEQRCVDGVHEWTEIAEEGQDPHELDAPAPVLALSGSGEHAHGAETETASSDPLPLALGAGGALRGAAALVVAITAFRRRS